MGRVQRRRNGIPQRLKPNSLEGRDAKGEALAYLEATAAAPARATTTGCGCKGKRGQGRGQIAVGDGFSSASVSWLRCSGCQRFGGREATARAKAKCGGLSAAAAKAPPSVEMTSFCVGITSFCVG
jgi:hypothetical protein